MKSCSGFEEQWARACNRRSLHAVPSSSSSHCIHRACEQGSCQIGVRACGTDWLRIPLTFNEIARFEIRTRAQLKNLNWRPRHNMPHMGHWGWLKRGSESTAEWSRLGIALPVMPTEREFEFQLGRYNLPRNNSLFPLKWFQLLQE